MPNLELGNWPRFRLQNGRASLALIYFLSTNHKFIMNVYHSSDMNDITTSSLHTKSQLLRTWSDTKCVTCKGAAWAWAGGTTAVHRSC